MISLPDISFPLLQPKNLVEFIGPDPAEQRIVLLLCFEDFGRRLPALRVAVATSDGLTIVRTARLAQRRAVASVLCPVLRTHGSRLLGIAGVFDPR
jgi:hypothetical protein